MAWQRGRRYITCLAVACATCILLSGCGMLSGNDRQIQLAITGDKLVYDYDVSIFNAIDMAQEDANDLYATKGFHVSYQTSDDEAVYDKGVRQASDFIKDKNITAILGTHNFVITDMTAELAQQNNKLLVAFNGCNDSVTQMGYTTVLNNIFNAQQSGETLAKYVNRTPEIHRIAIYNSSVGYELDWINSFVRGLDINGGQVVDCVGTVANANDFAAMAERWSLLQVDTVLIVEYFSDDAYDAAENLHRLLPQLHLLGDFSFDYDAKLQESGATVEGLVIPDVLMSGEGNSIDAFNKRYFEKFGQMPSRWAAHAYDTVRMIVDTAVKIDSTDSVKIAEALHSEEGYTGVCGTAKFDANGKLIDSKQGLLICRGGKFVALE